MLDQATLQLPDPVFLLSLYNERVREGKMRLHPWQVKFARNFAADWNYTERVKRQLLIANNGSGKSAIGIAPCSVWLSMRYPQARSVITSSSGVQLDRQTGRAIRHVCEQVNRLHGRDEWDIKYREYTYKPTGSTIEMYATDEPGKAEGYHPHYDGGMFAMFVDEAKTVTDDIFQAISRCNGMTHFVLVSSPGTPQGFFYNAACDPDFWNVTKVTAYDCPHIRKDEIEGAKRAYGEYSPFFRSAYLAEFTSVNEAVIIPYEVVMEQLRNPPAYVNDNIRRAGVDISGGGDENAISVWQGNREIGLECFRFSDMRAVRIHLTGLFRKYELSGPNINIDDGYVGRAVIHELRDHGYECNAVRFGAAAINNVAYGNRGTELWWNFSRLLPHLILLGDDTRRNQLASRYYKQSNATSKIILESKREARAHGHHSPDRADGTVLAWATTALDYFDTLGHAATTQREIDSIYWKISRERLQSGKLTPDEVAEAVDIYREVRAEQRRKAEEAEDLFRGKYTQNGRPTSRLSDVLGLSRN